jgi:hypothetical protein
VWQEWQADVVRIGERLQKTQADAAAVKVRLDDVKASLASSIAEADKLRADARDMKLSESARISAGSRLNSLNHTITNLKQSVAAVQVEYDDDSKGAATDATSLAYAKQREAETGSAFRQCRDGCYAQAKAAAAGTPAPAPTGSATPGLIPLPNQTPGK